MWSWRYLLTGRMMNCVCRAVIAQAARPTDLCHPTSLNGLNGQSEVKRAKYFGAGTFLAQERLDTIW